MSLFYVYVFPNNCYYSEPVEVIITDLSASYFDFKITPNDVYNFIKHKHI
jgi:hypothetical protein